MTGADYLKLLKRPIEKLTVPQFGEVHVRGLTAPEYDTLEMKSVKQIEGKDAFVLNTAFAIRYGMVNADGSHVFTDADLPALANLPNAVARPLRVKILNLSGVGIDQGNS